LGTVNTVYLRETILTKIDQL